MAVSEEVEKESVDDGDVEDDSERFNLQAWINEGLEGNFMKHIPARTIKVLLELSWASAIATIFLGIVFLVAFVIPTFTISFNAFAGAELTLSLVVYNVETNCTLSQTE